MPAAFVRPSSSLDPLFSPKSIAVIGASASPGKAGHEMLRALSSYQGKIFAINRKSDKILNHDCYAAVGDLPVAPDLAVLCVQAAMSVDSIRQAGESGVKAAMIISGGFAEAGDEGKKIQSECRSLCDKYGIRLLGPNTSGFVVPEAGLRATFAPGTETLAPGTLGVISQSGGVNLTLGFMAQDAGLGVRLAVGLGNALDVTAADVINYLSDDAAVKVIALHLEGVVNGRELKQAVRQATSKVPVIVLITGKEKVGDFAQSHTGAMIGDYDVKRVAMEQAGAIVVDTAEQLIDACAAFSRYRLPPLKNPGAALITGQAGPGLLILDTLKSQNIATPRLSSHSQSKIGALLPPMTYTENPVDTGRPSPAFSEIVSIVASDPSIDIMIVNTIHEPAAIKPVDLFRSYSAKEPLIFSTSGPQNEIGEATAAIRNLGIPVLTAPERAANAAAALCKDAASQYRDLQARAAAPNARHLDVSLPLSEAAAKEALEIFGVQSPKRAACKNLAEAIRASKSLKWPLAAKISSVKVKHKTELGGVVLNINDEQSLKSAVAKIVSIEPDVEILIEEMAPEGLELIVGGVRDPSFGPVILVGIGGVFAEALNDNAKRVGPIDRADAFEMLDELKGRKLFEGWRGGDPIDQDAVVEVLLAVSSILEAAPDVREIEINPLRAFSKGALALDALVV